MKILITTDLLTVTTNGVVTSLKNLWHEMQKRGHDVKILTFSESKKSYKDNRNEVYYIKSYSMEWVYPGVRMPKTYRDELVKELIEWKPDIIHSQCEFFSYFFALEIAKKTGAKLVHTYHTMYEDYVGYVIKFSKKTGKFAVKNFVKNRLNKSDWVIAPTSKAKELLVRYKIKPPISIIPSGISIDQHNEKISSDERSKKRLTLGIEKNDVVMLTLGRLGYEKNVDELINYYAKAREKHKNIKFLIVGDGPAKEKLEKLTADLALSGEVIFVGRVGPNEVHKYYQLGDLFVSASTSETQGLTYIESAANALPLLCRNDPCLNGVIEQGENGYSYNTEAEFITYLSKMVNDDKWRANASKKSSEISRKFDRSVFGDSIEKIYNELLK